MPLCFSTVNLIPTTPIVEERPFHAPDGGIGVAVGKSRKRVFPQPHTQEPNPIFEAYGYCNIPNRTEQAWEGETCTVTQKKPKLNAVCDCEFGYVRDIFLRPTLSLHESVADLMDSTKNA